MITGNGKASYAYLGRPWGPFGRVVYAYTYMDQCVRHEGWNNWGKCENERSACFYEYRYLNLLAINYQKDVLVLFREFSFLSEVVKKKKRE